MINNFDLLIKKGYSVGPVIGEGSYGKIRLGKYGNKSVAIKMLSKNKDMQGFLSNEVDTLLSLKHKNIVKIFDVVETQKHVCIVMELAEGGDLLEKVMKCGAFSMKETKRIFREIVGAVAYCHSQNIAHRDLKLENILLGNDDEVKVCDFGFARKVAKSELSRTFCGSASYCPPEVLQGKAYNAFSVDVWSLGVILYALINGGFPFEESNINQMVACQLEKQIPVLEKVDFQCLALIERMLEPNTEKRATIEEVLNSSWLKEC